MTDPQSSPPGQVSITVKFFASLRERVGVGQVQIEVPAGSTAHEVWMLTSKETSPPERVLVAVNQEYVAWSHRVQLGDEVAFFPPVTGG